MADGSGSVAADASCCLMFGGDSDVSSGLYLPSGYTLSLRGDDLAQHHVAHLHEIHHKALNDDTAWGALVHVVARHPGWSPPLLTGMVDACRVVHESFASFMSLSLARTRHADVDRVLDAYPLYRPLADRLARLLIWVPEGHRRDIAATGVARWCMSGPVLDLALEAYPTRIALADVPSVLRPDHRYRMMLRLANPAAVRVAVEGADAAFAAAHGRHVQDLSLDESDAVLDSAWAEWEDAFVRGLVRSSDQLQAMPTVAADAHLDAADRLVDALARDGVDVGLPHDRDEGALTDVESVRRLVVAASVRLREPYRAALAEPGVDVDLGAVLGLCEAATIPFVVVHGRQSEKLAQSFRFGSADAARLDRRSAGPLFAVRVLIDDDDGDDDGLILHAELPDPGAYGQVVAEWGDRGVAGNCITASCFLDAAWQREWLPALSGWPTVVLVDTSLPGMVGPGRLLGSTEHVYGAYLGLAHPYLSGLMWHVEGHAHVMLAVGDDLTVQLLAGQLADLLGDRLWMSDADWSQWLPVLSAVAGSVVATESRLAYDGAVRL